MEVCEMKVCEKEISEISTIVEAELANLTSDDLEEINGMKLVLNVDLNGVRSSDWIERNGQHIDRLIRENGALLLRGIKTHSSKQFASLLENVFGASLLDYNYRSTPRTGLKGNVYTATEYSCEEVIPQHNENAYSRRWPLRIGFLCMLPSVSGGATPISDSRYIYENLPLEIRQKFEDKGVMYVRNYSNIDLPWKEVFQTEDKSVVEKYCFENEIQCDWQDDKLKTVQINPAVVLHPETNEKLWFNQAHLFHISNHSKDTQTTMLEAFTEEGLPRNTYFGDGTPIDANDLDVIRDLYNQSKVRFDWERYDVLLLDNMRFTHGREAYTGERKILTGMAKPNV